MRTATLWLLAVSLCAQTRYARLGEIDGSVEAQIHPTEASSTFARYNAAQDPREIDPRGFAEPPKDPLVVAAFLEALPSPRLRQERLEFVRDPDRAAVIRLAPSSSPADRWVGPQPDRVQPVTQAQPALWSMRAAMPPLPVIVMQEAPARELIAETYYVSPIYAGIIVMNPPEKKLPEKNKQSTVPDETAH